MCMPRITTLYAYTYINGRWAILVRVRIYRVILNKYTTHLDIHVVTNLLLQLAPPLAPPPVVQGSWQTGLLGCLHLLHLLHLPPHRRTRERERERERGRERVKERVLSNTIKLECRYIVVYSLTSLVLMRNPISYSLLPPSSPSDWYKDRENYD